MSGRQRARLSGEAGLRNSADAPGWSSRAGVLVAAAQSGASPLACRWWTRGAVWLSSAKPGEHGIDATGSARSSMCAHERCMNEFFALRH
jgi:hypothetical protein